ncbi:MAG: tRNA (adenosine(37)-N6)-threonylcarbamoyltransferase complex dimerization subunit type 1 TsaB [Actinomycetales bacterium]|nr:tRNA (adenosine(37)-N6)-threonylcarbamoyltransferase complex dimerization subunit type 1 TsaB [Candidatus Phosphoribacter baldrii]MBK6955841.1 tRNA (adenosine(37)-N6)-threonylcarbamoyltransferase complex dimerization subunit type 1 TsaB [Candidatus Phosphoribacter baldrii]
MLLLALDTSTSAITVALHDGARVLAEATTLDARAHGERLAPGIREVLEAAGATPGDLTHVVCGLGPGPFTGLRVGIVTARVLALVTGAALHGVCSLDALAAAGPEGEVLVATDARRKEVYWARYAVSPGSVRALSAPAVTKPAELAPQVRALPTVGRGPVLYPGLFPAPVDVLDVSAAALADLAVARLAAGEELADREPLYLRRPDAAPNVVAKSALG